MKFAVHVKKKGRITPLRHALLSHHHVNHYAVSLITFQITHVIDNDSIVETLKEMQNKCLINTFYRPTEASNTTSKTPQSILSQSETPPAEENHFITINDSINKPIPPFLNRSLPATPIIEPNTTPRVFSIVNFS